MPNKLSQFWQELKRRNVVRVITVYAASSFVILELVDIIAPSLGLPGWTLNLVLILLVVGFIIAVIVSWIYDIHPEGGIVKTEFLQDERSEGTPAASNSWKIASYVSFVVIVGLIVLNVIPTKKESEITEILEKSIAVLPFKNDSPNQERMYFINGTMEAILDNLCKIEDLRVVSRNSVEQYRNNPKPTPVIAEEMAVSYILEGSGHRDGDNVRLFVQLLDGKKDQHLWSKSYDANIEDIFSLQSEIAQLVASEIEAIITPEEKSLIEKIPTLNLTAYDFSQRGREEFVKYWWIDRDNRASLDKAENYYQKALEYDPTFAQAYTGLAWVYWGKHYWEEYFSETFLDSVLILCDIALSYDSKIADAHIIKGNYYKEKGNAQKAIDEFDKAIDINPNAWQAYYRGFLHHDDLVKSISDRHNAADLNRGPQLPDILRELANRYSSAGFQEQAKHYVVEAFKLDGDTAEYYSNLAHLEGESLGNYESAIDFLFKGYEVDSNNVDILLRLGYYHLFSGQPEKSLKYYEKYIERLKALGNLSLNHMQRIGYAYSQNGYQAEAEYYFDMQVEFCNMSIALGRFYAQNRTAYYDLAVVYAFRGEKDNAIANLRIFNQRESMHWWMVTLIKNDPMFDSMRDEPEFQQIVHDVEVKYQAEHERVRQWLEENDMI